jgi:hypothetical protein
MPRGRLVFVARGSDGRDGCPADRRLTSGRCCSITGRACGEHREHNEQDLRSHRIVRVTRSIKLAGLEDARRDV